MAKLIPAIIAALCFAVLALAAVPAIKDATAKVNAALVIKMPEDSAGRPVYQR